VHPRLMTNPAIFAGALFFGPASRHWQATATSPRKRLFGIGEGTLDGLFPARRAALRLDLHEASSGQVLQIAGSLL
jgi:hypothetical protein